MERIARLRDAAGKSLKHALHTVVFSMSSSPANQTDAAVEEWLNRGSNSSASISPRNASKSIYPEPGWMRTLESGVGPLSLLGSGYGMTLVVMAILLNRIHHIVQRPRPPPPPFPHPPVGMRQALQLQMQRLLTSPNMPTWLRLPGLLALGNAWLLFTVLILQVAGFWPVDAADHLAANTLANKLPAPIGYMADYCARVIDRLGVWAGGKEMSDVSWTVFMCVCTGLVFGAFANGLDRARDVGANFNLFGFSFLLHVYASPEMHHNPPQGAKFGRPDVNELVQLWVGLTELTWLQAIELSPTLRRNQLLPTGVCGAIGLAHFCYMLGSYPPRFPSFTFLTHLFGLCLSVIVICTLVVRAFTHLFTLGYLPSPIWRNLLPHEGAIPSTEDDVGVALLKLSSACISVTTFSGLRNELAPVEEVKPWVQLSANGGEMFTPSHAEPGFGMRIDDIQASELRDPNGDSPVMRELDAFGKACATLATDIFWFFVMSTPLGRTVYSYAWRAYHARWWYGPRQWRFWRRQAWAAPERRPEDIPQPTFPAGAFSSAVQVRRRLPYPTSTPVRRNVGNNDEDWTYDQVLRGEVVVEDDEDDGWESDGSGLSVATVLATGDNSDDDDNEQASLFRDLVTREGTPGSPGPGPEDNAALQPIMVAHMTSTTSSPLTRRRYAALLSGSGSGTATPSSANLRDVVMARRGELAMQAEATAATQRDEWDDDRRQTCIVCMTQPRDVILWPCRCLLMCNDCRDSLAVRLNAKDHMCPHCRTKVDGYSRIYVP